MVGKVLVQGDRDLAVRRIAEHRRVWAHGVPVPKVLACADSNVLDGRLLSVSEYLPGEDAQAASERLPDGSMAAIVASAGAAVARLHSVPVEVFGDSATGLSAGPASWAEVVTGRIAALRLAFGRSQRDDSGLLSAGLALLSRLAEDVSPVVRPAVAHLDVYLPNILVDSQGDFRLLLDLEHVRWVDPVMDFVKPMMWIFERNPQWAGVFAGGYRSATPWPNRFSDRLSVAAGLELLTGADYWAAVGDEAMREDYLRRLRDWVTSGGAIHRQSLFW